jgi:hypothetical protein
MAATRRGCVQAIFLPSCMKLRKRKGKTQEDLAPAIFKEVLRKLRGLATASLTHKNQHLILANSIKKHLAVRIDRQALPHLFHRSGLDLLNRLLWLHPMSKGRVMDANVGRWLNKGDV